MARNRIGLNFEGWEDMMENLDRLGGTREMKRAVTNALVASKEYVTPIIEKSVSNSNLPARGEYSFGGTKQSIDKSNEVGWSAMTGTINVGFDFEKSGPKSIYLMYGTPKMNPAKGLKSAIYGSKTKKKVAEIQSEEVNKVIQEIMGG